MASVTAIKEAAITDFIVAPGIATIRVGSVVVLSSENGSTDGGGWQSDHLRRNFLLTNWGGSIMKVSLVIILIFVWDVPSQKPSSYWDTVHWWKLPSKSAWSSMVVLALGTGSGKSTSWTDYKLLSSKIFQGYFWRGRYATYSSIHANRPCFVSSEY